jgi:hypothetical protein
MSKNNKDDSFDEITFRDLIEEMDLEQRQKELEEAIEESKKATKHNKGGIVKTKKKKKKMKKPRGVGAALRGYGKACK